MMLCHHPPTHLPTYLTRFLLPFPSPQELFGDVYAGPALLPHLAAQKEKLEKHMLLYPDHYKMESH